MESEDDLDILTALLTESEDAGGEERLRPAAQETEEDDLDDLFDKDDEDDEGEYRDGTEEDVVKSGETASDPSGDVDDVEDEKVEEAGEGEATGSLDKSREDLEEEMRRMQEKMQKLQQQLAASQKAAASPAASQKAAASPAASQKAAASPAAYQKAAASTAASQKASTPGRKPSTAASQKASTPGRKPSTAASTAASRKPFTAASPAASQKASTAASQKTSTPGRSALSPSGPKPRTPPAPQGASRQILTTKPTPGSTHKTKTQTVNPPATPERPEDQKLNDSSDFSAQLINADTFKRKPRVAHQTSSSPEERSPLVEIKMGSTFLPVETASSSGPRSSPAPKKSHPPAPKDVAVEKFSGLRLRRPRVSSTEMDNKMANRRMIRLSQLPERLAKEKLEDSDWVTFAVLVSKATPQSNSSGKTFSIWKLNDLHNLEVYVSLLLFGEVHKEHWKTEPGTVIGVLNPNPMKPKDGYDGVSLSVDHPQKVLVMGEAVDYGTCKAAKKNGEPCSQLVNLYECQYCQYHVKAQYKKAAAKRSELQSSFSGKATGKVKAKGGSLKDRLCNEGFHYGGVSSSAVLSKPGSKSTQGTLDKLFVKGSAKKAKPLALKSGEVSGCTDDFKTLMAVQTPGALQMMKHLTKPSAGGAAGEVQSITASELIKQQKQKQQELLEARRRRAEEIQNRVSPPRATPRGPPTLGRGFSEGEDILFFDHGGGGPSPSPPPPAAAPAAASSPSLSSAKLAALRKLRAKGGGALAREDPNAVKRKRSDGDGGDIISARVEKNLEEPDGESSGAEGDMPAQKKRREQLEYVESEEFQKILNAKSRHGLVLKAAEYQLQERYFDVLVQKEQMEEKMRGTTEMKCRAVSCKKCNYTYFKPADRCVEQNHALHWHESTKRFFKCPCGQRAIALDRLPHKHCSNCGLFKWERDGMLKEKKGPKLGAETLLPRGEEHGRFLN